MSEEIKLENMELNDKAIESVAGGGDDSGITQLKCESCRGIFSWRGNYMNDKWYDCPKCKAKGTGHGIKYRPN